MMSREEAVHRLLAIGIAPGNACSEEIDRLLEEKEKADSYLGEFITGEKSEDEYLAAMDSLEFLVIDDYLATLEDNLNQVGLLN